MTDQISFPPLRELPPGHREVRKQHLLSEIAHVRKPSRLFASSRSWKSVLVVAALVVTLLGAVGIGIAASFGAFNAYHGIGAVQQQQLHGTSDAIDPATAAWAKEHLAGIQLDTARHLGQLPNGQEVYVITGTQNDLCVLRGPPEIDSACGAPLSRAHPATINTLLTEKDPGTRWIIYGIALNGVTSVSFHATEADDGSPTGPEVTVPVKSNLWVYPSHDTRGPTMLQPVTAHFADGTTVTEPATGANCGAC
jgi:hypothetical protein